MDNIFRNKKIIKYCGCNLFPKSPDDNIYYEEEKYL